MTDEKLLMKAGRGDERAFALLYERYSEGLCRFVYRFLQSSELAQEVTDDCFLSLIRHPERFDPSRASLRTYLYAAARNMAFTHLRRASNDSLIDDFDEAIYLTGKDEPLRRLLMDELSEKVRQAIADLPPLQREVLILFEYEEFSLAQIAEIVEVDVGAVKSRLFRARERLRRSLSPYFKSTRAVASGRTK